MFLKGQACYPVPWSSRWSWSLHLFLGRLMFLPSFGLYCSACFVSLFVSILCTCCSHFSWYCRYKRFRHLTCNYHKQSWPALFSSSSLSSSSCSWRVRHLILFLDPQDEVGPSISSSVVLCFFVLLVYIVVLVLLVQRFPTFLTRGALFRINFYGGAPCLPYVLQVNGV
jgi:hypothetical protein